MGQWGKERIFVEGKARIRVLPHVSTIAFDPIISTSVIDWLLLLDAEGETNATTDRIFTEISEQHLHKPYADWLIGTR